MYFYYFFTFFLRFSFVSFSLQSYERRFLEFQSGIPFHGWRRLMRSISKNVATKALNPAAAAAAAAGAGGGVLPGN
jgi:hypothetical protein